MAWGFKAGSYADDGAGFVAAPGTFTVTLGAAIVSGDRIVLGVQGWTVSGAVAPTYTVADNVNSGAYTEDKTLTYLTNGRISIFSKSCNASGTPVITLTASVVGGANVQGGLQCVAYTGLLASDPGSDVSAASSGVTASATSGATGATTAANELVVGFFGDPGDGSTLTATGSLTQRGAHQSDVNNWEGLLGDKDSGASGSTPTATLTMGTAGGWGMAAVVYKLAAVTFDPSVVPWAVQLPEFNQTALIEF